jgi:rhodanese-related sulfurtransferase
MSKENPLWGAPRIHGELLKLGFEIAESTVSKYMIRRRGPPSQTWRTFLRNHAEAIAAIDLCVVPTLTFECLFAFLVVGHGRRQLLWFAVTRHPTAEWLAQQILEAFPWSTAPTYLVRDNDRAYGQAFTRRLRTRHLPGAVNIPLRDLEARLAEIDPAHEIVAYCRGPYCVLSYEAVAALRTKGFKARRLEDGFPEWRAAGLPVEIGLGH